MAAKTAFLGIFGAILVTVGLVGHIFCKYGTIWEIAVEWCFE